MTQTEWWSKATQDMHYRCVCGEDLSFTLNATSIQCPKCDRVYGEEAFKQVLDPSLQKQTIQSSITWSDLAEPVPKLKNELKSGDRIEHFKIIDVLGRGGMGAVYRAVDESLERYVALKVIEKKINKSKISENEHLLQEARAQARLNHPNVVQIFYVQHKADSAMPFFAMELVQGETLEDRLKAGPIDFSEVIDLSLQIVDALKHARIYDTVHGDIKPSNILFSSANTVKLADFGLSRKVTESEEQGGKGIVGGTPAYLSPEIARGESSDFRSDMYSLGVMLFQMTFDKSPYVMKRNDLKAYVDAHKSSEIDFPSKWPNSLPEGWKDLLEKLLAKQPDDRFQNYDELLSALKQLRPQNYPIAGRLSRGLAWLIDLSVALGLNFVFVGPILNNIEFLRSRPVLGVISLVLPLIVPYLVCFLQGYWKTSPGKKLFQLCIMDKHGKGLSRSKLEFRMIWQMLPLILLNIGIYIQLLGDNKFLGLTFVISAGFLLIDFLFGFFAKQRRSLHDWLLGTRVVIDLKGHEQELQSKA